MTTSTPRPRRLRADRRSLWPELVRPHPRGDGTRRRTGPAGSASHVQIERPGSWSPSSLPLRHRATRGRISQPDGTSLSLLRGVAGGPSRPDDVRDGSVAQAPARRRRGCCHRTPERRRGLLLVRQVRRSVGESRTSGAPAPARRGVSRCRTGRGRSSRTGCPLRNSASRAGVNGPPRAPRSAALLPSCLVGAPAARCQSGRRAR